MMLRCIVLVLSFSVTSGLRLVATTPTTPALVTTAYWHVKSKWGEADRNATANFPKTVLNLNSKMVIYGDDYSLALMKSTRDEGKVPLVGAVSREIKTLPPCNWASELYEKSAFYTHPKHVPSVEVGCIWSSKLTLQLQSMEEHPEYQWHVWLDVGMHDRGARTRLIKYGVHHGQQLWPNPEKLKNLTEDKMFVAPSHHNLTCQDCKEWDYCHCISAMAWAVSKKLLPRMVELFSQYQHKCIESKPEPAFPCMSEQVILTRIAKDHPDLFSWATGINGFGWYGAAADDLSFYRSSDTSDTSDSQDLISALSD